MNPPVLTQDAIVNAYTLHLIPTKFLSFIHILSALLSLQKLFEADGRLEADVSIFSLDNNPYQPCLIRDGSLCISFNLYQNLQGGRVLKRAVIQILFLSNDHVECRYHQPIINFPMPDWQEEDITLLKSQDPFIPRLIWELAQQMFQD